MFVCIGLKFLRDGEYDYLFAYFERREWSNKLIVSMGKWAPMGLMGFHFAFFTITHWTVALITFYSTKAQIVFLIIWILFSLNVTEKYYSAFFKFTKNVRLQQLLGDITLQAHLS